MSHDLLALRGYQRNAIDAVWQAHESGMKRPAVVLPTGSGKTVVFSHAIAEYVERTGRRAMVLVHRDELADQALAKLHQVAPQLAAGKVKAEHDDVHAQVVVASVQTVSRRGRLARLIEAQERHGRLGFVITDECHHGAAESYKRIYSALGDAVHLGVTATMSRGDGVGLGLIWDDVVYSRSVLRMIADGYLVDVRAQDITTELDLSGVKKTGGDYQAGALGAAMVEAGVPEQVARAVREHAADRKSIVFTPDVATAYETAKALEAVGLRSGRVDGTTPRDVRQQLYRDFADGKLRALVNCMVLTEGFDSPTADCVVVARPTTSPGLYAQMVGRGLRPAPWAGKTDCLVLNVAGASGRISTLIDLAEGEVMPRSGLKPRESLGEAALRAMEEEVQEEQSFAQQEAARQLAFQLKRRDVDLFAGSSQVWLRTYGGVMFVPAGDAGQMVLWPSRQESADGQPLWDVAYVPKRGIWQRLHEGMPLGVAMAWAETEADDHASFGVRKGAAWRKKKASTAQVELAQRLHLPVAEHMRAGEVGDLLSVHFASRVIDRKIVTAPGHAGSVGAAV